MSVANPPKIKNYPVESRTPSHPTGMPFFGVGEGVLDFQQHADLPQPLQNAHSSWLQSLHLFPVQSEWDPKRSLQKGNMPLLSRRRFYIKSKVSILHLHHFNLQLVTLLQLLPPDNYIHFSLKIFHVLFRNLNEAIRACNSISLG